MKQLLIFFSVFLISCSTYPYLYHFEQNNCLNSQQKIAVMPLNLIIENRFSKDERINKIIMDALIDRLRYTNNMVVDLRNNIVDFDSIKKQCEFFFDPYSGKLNINALDNYLKICNEYVAKNYGVCSTVYPSLIFTTAVADHYSIRWHGRQRYSNYFGSLPAMSLYVKVVDSNNKMIFDHAGGLQLLIKFEWFSYSDLTVKDALKNPSDIEKSLDIIFKPVEKRKYSKKK